MSSCINRPVHIFNQWKESRDDPWAEDTFPPLEGNHRERKTCNDHTLRCPDVPSAEPGDMGQGQGHDSLHPLATFTSDRA